MPDLREGREQEEDVRLRRPDDRLLLRRLQGQVRQGAQEVHRQGEGVQEEEGLRRGHLLLRGPDQQEVPDLREGREQGEDVRLRRPDDRLLLRRLQGQVRQGAQEVHRQGEGVQEEEGRGRRNRLRGGSDQQEVPAVGKGREQGADVDVRGPTHRLL